MADSVARFSLWLEFEQWQPEPADEPEDDFFNMKVTLASGRVYALNVWTFKFLENAIHAVRFGDPSEQARALSLDLIAKHPLERQYLMTPDLLVARLDRKLIEDIIGHMLDEWGEQLNPEWECRD
jgi:hypothetical protein